MLHRKGAGKEAKLAYLGHVLLDNREGLVVSRATVPTISPMLQIHEPTAFPRAIPESPRVLAVTDTTSSGVVVARLTSVPPMTKRGMCSARPMTRLESTKRSPPLPISASPMVIRTTSSNNPVHLSCRSEQETKSTAPRRGLTRADPTPHSDAYSVGAKKPQNAAVNPVAVPPQGAAEAGSDALVPVGCRPVGQ